MKINLLIYYKRGKNKGEIKDKINIGSNTLINEANNLKHSYYMFKDFADGAIAIWEFLAKHAEYEWGPHRV